MGLGVGHRSDKLLVVYALVAACAVALFAVWWPRSNIVINRSLPIGTAIDEALLIGVCCFSRFAVRQPPSNRQSLLGRGFHAAFTFLGELTFFFALIGPMVVIFGMLSYIGTAIGGPLQDDRLASIDAAMGFYWPSFLAFINGIPHAAPVIELAYQSHEWQLAPLAILLILLRQSRRLTEMATLLGMTAMLTIMVYVLIPNIGAYSYFQPSPEHFDTFDRIIGGEHVDQFMQLRSGAPFVLSHAVGLISFPSFHTVMAILLAYAARGIPFVRIGSLVLNSLMVLGALTTGAHYLTDIIAGAAIAVLCIITVRAIEERSARILSTAAPSGCASLGHQGYVNAAVGGVNVVPPGCRQTPL